MKTIIVSTHKMRNTDAGDGIEANAINVFQYYDVVLNQPDIDGARIALGSPDIPTPGQALTLGNQLIVVRRKATKDPKNSFLYHVSVEYGTSQ